MKKGTFYSVMAIGILVIVTLGAILIIGAGQAGANPPEPAGRCSASQVVDAGRYCKSPVASASASSSASATTSTSASSSATTSTSASTQPTLPVTGSAAVGMLSAGTLLLLVGIPAVLFARRRRLAFRA